MTDHTAESHDLIVCDCDRCQEARAGSREIVRVAREARAHAVFAIHGDPEREQASPADVARNLAGARFTLVEVGRGGSRRWYTRGDDPRDLVRASDEQEGSEDWVVSAVYDLDTAERVTLRREYLIVGRDLALLVDGEEGDR